MLWKFDCGRSLGIMPTLIYIIIFILGIFCMNMSRIDLNLLVYLDVLLRECNVTRAAEELGISQPAMSNSLRRLRDLFDDPILVRTSDGMTPTDRALELQPLGTHSSRGGRASSSAKDRVWSQCVNAYLQNHGKRLQWSYIAAGLTNAPPQAGS